MIRFLFSFLFWVLLPLAGLFWFYQSWLSPNLSTYEASLNHEIVNAYRIQKSSPQSTFSVDLNLVEVKPEELKSTLTGEIKEIFAEENSIIDEVPYELFNLNHGNENLLKQLDIAEIEINPETKKTPPTAQKTINGFYIEQPLKIMRLLIQPKQKITSGETILTYLPQKPRLLKATLPKEKRSFVQAGQTIEIEPKEAKLFSTHSIGIVQSINFITSEMTIALPLNTAFLSFPENVLYRSTIGYQSTTAQVRIPKTALMYNQDQLMVLMLKQEINSPGLYQIIEVPVTLDQFLNDGWASIKTPLKRSTLIISDANDKRIISNRAKTFRIQYDIRYMNPKVKNGY